MTIWFWPRCETDRRLQDHLVLLYEFHGILFKEDFRRRLDRSAIERENGGPVVRTGAGLTKLLWSGPEGDAATARVRMSQLECGDRRWNERRPGLRLCYEKFGLVWKRIVARKAITLPGASAWGAKVGRGRPCYAPPRGRVHAQRDKTGRREG